MKISYYWGALSELKEAYDIHRSRVMNKFSLTALEVDIILFLANNPQYDTATEIVNNRKISKSHVSQTVNSLYQKGMLEKTEDKENLKRIHLKLTPATKDIVKMGQMEQREYLNNVMEGLSEDEVYRLVQSLMHISSNINEKYTL